MPIAITDAAVQKRQQERERMARERREFAQRTVMGQSAGQAFVWDVLERVCGLFGGSHVHGDALATAFNEGRRSVGIQLMTELQRLSPQGWTAMLLEATQAQNGEASIRASESVPSGGDRTGP